MGWINIEDGLPTYYECVFAELITGDVVDVWRASDGEHDIWTKFGTDQCFDEDDIVKWAKKEI